MKLLAALLLLCPVLSPAGEPEGGRPGSYARTEAVLREAYTLKMRSHLVYVACARKAKVDGFRNTAHLFTALVASESVHARGLKGALKELGREPPAGRWPDVPSRTTGENILAAAAEETVSIEKELPALIERARPEGHVAALLNLSRALETDRRHLELLNARSGTRARLAELLSRWLSRARLRLLVCDNCGFIADGSPGVRCKGCEGPVSAYHDPVSF